MSQSTQCPEPVGKVSLVIFKIGSTLSDCLKYSQFSSHDTARADVLYASAQPPPQSNGAGALVVL